MKRKILLVGDYNRSDFLYIAKQLHNEADFFFIEFLNSRYLKNHECLQYGKVLYWKDFKDAYDLLNTIKPTRVVFYFIEAYNHVALNVASKILRVPTYHLEHGIRNLKFKIELEYERGNIKKPVSRKAIEVFKNLSDAFDKYNNKQFFFNTAKKSPRKEKAFLYEYYAVRSKNNIYNTFLKVRNELRLPDIYISFSPLIFTYHKEFEKLSSNFPVRHIGIPFFDLFYKWRTFVPKKENILFIDQPLFEHKLMGWTKEYKLSFLKELQAFAVKTGRIIYLKPHPSNDPNLYSEVPLTKNIIIISESNWEPIINNIDTVIGFSSALFLPFMAMENICCFSIEAHPNRPKSLYSQLYVDTGVCHAVNSIDELEEKMRSKDLILSKQKEYKQTFIQNWMHKFDGKSSERLKKVLIEDEVA